MNNNKTIYDYYYLKTSIFIMVRKLSKQDIICKTLECEGYYVNDANDNGGMTYRGIARNSFPKWEGWKIVDLHLPLKKNQKIDDIQLDAMIVKFYEDRFYKPLGCDKILNDGVAMHLYDMGVNAGLSASRKILQRAINKTYPNAKLKVDGIVGQITLTWANKEDKAKELQDNVAYCRIQYYSQLKSAKYFLKGWTNRVNKLQSWLATK